MPFCAEKARVMTMRSHGNNRDSGSRAFIETLEGRTLLSAAPHIAHGDLHLKHFASTFAPAGFSPSQIRHAYGFDKTLFTGGAAGDGSGQTIAIVDAYD